MNSQKAEIIGFLCAEGCFYKYTTKYMSYDPRRNAHYPATQNVKAIEFGNNNPVLQKRFLDLLNSVYNYKRRVTGVKRAQKIVIKRTVVMNDLLKYTRYGSSEWNVPKEIIKGGLKTKSSFLRGIFDGDGSFDFVRNRIRLSSTNHVGIKQVYILLKTLGIESRIEGPYKKKGKKDAYILIVNKKKDLKKYLKLISSNRFIGIWRLKI